MSLGDERHGKRTAAAQNVVIGTVLVDEKVVEIVVSGRE